MLRIRSRLHTNRTQRYATSFNGLAVSVLLPFGTSRLCSHRQPRKRAIIGGTPHLATKQRAHRRLPTQKAFEDSCLESGVWKCTGRAGAATGMYSITINISSLDYRSSIDANFKPAPQQSPWLDTLVSFCEIPNILAVFAYKSIPVALSLQEFGGAGGVVGMQLGFSIIHE